MAPRGPGFARGADPQGQLIHVYVCICVHVRVRVHVHVCVSVRVNVHMRVHAHSCGIEYCLHCGPPSGTAGWSAGESVAGSKHVANRAA